MKNRLFPALAALGFLLILTERSGGPWAGTFVGLALFLFGSAALSRFLPLGEGGAKRRMRESDMRKFFRGSGYKTASTAFYRTEKTRDKAA